MKVSGWHRERGRGESPVREFRVRRIVHRALLASALLAHVILPSCGGGGGGTSTGGGGTGGSPTVFSNYHLTGLTTPVRDPSIALQNGTYYVFSTDAGLPGPGSLPILCSKDRVVWGQCGVVFQQIPAWVHQQVPLATGLWAPDISYFNGLYHVYYAASSFASNTSAIGLATNVTLDPTDPNYQWVDQGEILGSQPTDDFNAIDPTILVDTDGSVWMTYGSFWTGIKQRQIDPTTGELGADPTVYSLAMRPGVMYDPIEGSSLVHRGDYYYLFASFDSCCNSDPYLTTYRIMVGRGTSPHGPFIDMNGTDMMQGGGTQLLAGNGVTWNAPGGETVLIDSVNGDLIVFHAIHLPDGAAYLFVNSLAWPNDWPQIQP
ncbi:MAG: arabinan endo-1,5-alpha-L-arabinosidase [Candidatus Acidiferrales bacterium]